MNNLNWRIFLRFLKYFFVGCLLVAVGMACGLVFLLFVLSMAGNWGLVLILLAVAFVCWMGAWIDETNHGK